MEIEKENDIVQQVEQQGGSEKNEVKEEATSSFISATTSFGIKGIKSFGKVFVLFFLVNIVGLISAVYKISAMYGIYVFIIGAIFTFLALYLTYKHVLTLGITHIYKYSSPIFRRISNTAVDKFMAIPINTNNAGVAKAIDAGKILSDTYGKKVPSFGKKAINFIMKRIPFVPIITELKTGINQTSNKEEIQDLAYSKIDSYIQTEVLQTSMKNVYIVLAVNIVVLVAFIYYFASKVVVATPAIPI